MAVIIGGTSGAVVAFDTDLDNACDRLLSLQDERGDPSTWTLDSGFVEERKVGLEAIVLVADMNKFSDGVVNTNTLTSVSAPFTSDMVDQEIELEDLGTRVVTAFTSSSSIDFSGDAVSADTGVVFRVPLGRPAGTRILTGSGSYPIAARPIQETSVPTVVQWLVGRKP